MSVRNFRELADPVKTDTQRQASLERHRRETLAEIVAYNLSELRRLRELTQTELAGALGMNQPNEARLEHLGDMQLTTLRSYIEALGGTVEVTAVFGDERFPIAIG